MAQQHSPGFPRGLSNPWRQRLVACAAGGALIPAFAPFNLFFLALLSPWALWWLLSRSASPRQAAGLAWWYGLGQFGFGAYWIFVSIHTFGKVILPLALLLTCAFILFMALFPALLGWLWARGRPRIAHPVGAMGLFVALWVLLEWVRGWFLTGFPWLLLGYSQIDTPLAGWGKLLGVYGISLAVMLSMAVLASWRDTALRGRVFGLGLLVGLWGGGLLLQHWGWTEVRGRAIDVALVQGNVPQDRKWLAEELQPTLARYARLTRAHLDADLVVWPESAIPLFYQTARPYLQELLTLVQGRTELLTGILYTDVRDGRYYNSLLQLQGEVELYHKRHLVPFTEYLPLESLLGDLVAFMAVPMSNFSSGALDQPLLEVAGYPMASSICYEDAFGEETIRDLPEAAYLVNITNDAWFGTSIAPWQHLQIARMRALETERYMLRATNTGVTAVIDPWGRVEAQLPQFEAATLRGQITPLSGATPYVRWGNWPVVTLLSLALIGFAWRPRGKS